MLHTFETMGTVATVELPGYTSAETLMEAVEAVFADAEQRFSRDRLDSELSLVVAGSLAFAEASIDLRRAYDKAVEWGRLTGEAFRSTRADGTIDLTRIARAWTMDAASKTLQSAGMGNWCLNVGGDVLCLGARIGGAGWVTEISDPVDRDATLCELRLGDGRQAVATSTSSENGTHVWLGGSSQSSEFLQVSVSADDIVTANVLASAIMIGGQPTLNYFVDSWPIDVLTVDLVGELHGTPGFRAAVAA